MRRHDSLGKMSLLNSAKQPQDQYLDNKQEQN